MYFILYVVFVDFLLASSISATIMWIASNKFMREPSAENIEWGYSFDVHINATFPPLILLHFVMLLFYKVLFSQEWFIARLLGNGLWLLAISYYVYITFLGYNCKLKYLMMIPVNLNPSNCRHTSSEKVKNATNFCSHSHLRPLLDRNHYYRLEFKHIFNELLSLSCIVKAIKFID